jgi:hypothetical protein
LKNIFSIDCDDRFSVSATLFYSIAALCDDGNTMLLGFIPSMMSYRFDLFYELPAQRGG